MWYASFITISHRGGIKTAPMRKGSAKVHVRTSTKTEALY